MGGYQVTYAHRSYERNLSNCVEKPEKVSTSTGFEHGQPSSTWAYIVIYGDTLAYIVIHEGIRSNTW